MSATHNLLTGLSAWNDNQALHQRSESRCASVGPWIVAFVYLHASSTGQPVRCLTASLCHTFTHIQHTHTPPSQRRLAPLSEGVVQGDQLMCSYHGWQFNGAGKCTSVPQIEDPKAHATACASPRNCVRAFPVKVRS
jgi:hypothetical protein